MSLFEDKGSIFGRQGKSALDGAAGSMFGDDDQEDQEDQGAQPMEGETSEDFAKRVFSEAQSGFMQRAKAENDRMMLAVDSEFWFAVAFQTREQKEAFLAAFKERFNFPSDDDKYIDGWQFAKALGLTIPRAEMPYNKGDKIDAKWSAMSRVFGEE